MSTYQEVLHSSTFTTAIPLTNRLSPYLHHACTQQITLQNNVRGGAYHGHAGLCLLSGAQRQNDTFRPTCNTQLLQPDEPRALGSGQPEPHHPAKEVIHLPASSGNSSQPGRACSGRARGSAPCPGTSLVLIACCPFQARSKLLNQHRACRVSTPPHEIKF